VTRLPLDLTIDNATAIEARLKSLGWMAPNDTLEALERPGEGNMNRTLRARLTNGSLILKQSVPFVAKYPSIAAPPERIAVEAAFYAATAGSAAVAARLPRVLGYDPDNRLLALEDLGAASDLTACYADPAVLGGERRAALLDWLGLLHTYRLADPDPILANHPMRQLNHAHIFEIPLRADNGVDLDAITPGLTAVARELYANATLNDRMRALGDIYLGRAPHPSQAVLLHGDYYPGSWLADDTGVYVIDPEFAFVGPAEFDVGVLIAHFTFARISQQELAASLEHYRTSAGFSLSLALAFAGAEVIRRLLGVAQLPLDADLALKGAWLAAACTFLMTRWESRETQ
jgi:5-methylthioribose kinase